MAEDGHRSLEAQHAARAAAQLREALALWRGSPLADFRDEVFAQAEITRLETVRAEGCTEMQGFLFSKPMPAGEVEQFLRKCRNDTATRSARAQDHKVDAA